jgi:hypothetical protein
MERTAEVGHDKLLNLLDSGSPSTGTTAGREWLEIEGGVISSLMQQAIPAEAGGDYAMTSHGTIPGQPHLETETAVLLFAQALRPCCVAPGAHARCAAAAVATL